MNLWGAGPLVLGAALAVLAFSWLLPRPRGRFVAGGIVAAVAAAVVAAVWLVQQFGRPMGDAVGTALFVLFAAGALLGGTTLVVQRNPARGAIAFAFVILSTCGLFLLLAAPFLMAVTLIVYAGAIIVTFLFVLMLSRTAGPSDENDRSREPLLGSLAGFAFAGLVLLVLHVAATAEAAATGSAAVRMTEHVAAHDAASNIPAAGGAAAVAARWQTPLTDPERQALRQAIYLLEEALSASDADIRQDREQWLERAEQVRQLVVRVVGAARGDELHAGTEGSLPRRLVPEVASGTGPPRPHRDDAAVRELLEHARRVRDRNWQAFKRVERELLAPAPQLAAVRAEWRNLHHELLLLAGRGELPARTVSNLGYLLYSEYLLAVELAAVLLLIATVGAVAIAQRRAGEAA